MRRLSLACLAAVTLGSAAVAASSAIASGADAARTDAPRAGASDAPGAGRPAAGPSHSDRIADVLARVATPPDDARAMVRWWWFGPAVTNLELERDLRAMKAGGFGGVEIQPVYPMELDDAARGIRNLPYLSPEFLDSISFANNKAHDLGLRVDMTLGSGWPFGGPHVSVADSAGRLLQRVAEVPAGAASVALPALASGEQLLAAFIGAGNAKAFDAARLRPIAAAPAAAGRAAVAPAGEPRVAVFYVASHTGQQVKRPSLGAEGFVLDHLNRRAIDNHLRVVGEPLLKAFGDKPPYAVFSDSLEVYNTDWTEDFLAEFQRRRGYDLKPHLPVIFTGQGPDAAALRHDWALTQTELVNERYLTPLDDWARKHGTQFRSQTYGEPVVTMSSNRLVALPEGEGPQFRSFSFTRWATSAGHLYGRNVISAETWTWLNSPAFSATPLDMKAEADHMLLQGVNQFIGHGWPHTPSVVQEPGYAFYAAAVFNDHQPWWNVMPDVNAYLQRTSYLLRQGAPANEVAVFLPVDDAYAAMNPGHMSVSAEMGKFVTPALMEQVLDAGHNVDFVDAESVLALGVSHKVLVMPRVSRLSPAVLAKLDAYVRGGGKIIAVASKPSLAPGFVDAARLTAQVAAASRALFARSGVQHVGDDAAVGAALARAVAPDFKAASSASDVGFIHRKLADGDIYFIANTSNRPVRTTASLRAARRHAAWIDPATGAIAPAPLTATASAAGAPRSALPLALAPYESRILVLTDAPVQLPTALPAAASPDARVPAGVDTPALTQRPSTPGPAPVVALALADGNALPLAPRPAASTSSPAGIVAGDHAAHAGDAMRAGKPGETVVADLSRDWLVTFPGRAPEPMSTLQSWTENEATRFLSAEVKYEKSVNLTEAQLRAPIALDFGEGRPLESTPKVPAGMRAMLESPIREAALVFVNGQRAGALWKPPYRLDITPWLKAGSNKIEVRVANLSLNMLAGQERPDHRLLWARYGQRFVPQDTQLIKPHPSGLLGPVRLLTEEAK